MLMRMMSKRKKKLAGKLFMCLAADPSTEDILFSKRALVFT